LRRLTVTEPPRPVTLTFGGLEGFRVSDAEILELVRAAFGGCPRPDHFFAGYQDDLEWADHDQMLRAHTVDTIGPEELCNPGWDPICQADTAAFLYYMPALARVLLGAMGEEYLTQFLFHLNRGRVTAFTAEQRGAVTRLLEHVRDTRGEAIEFDRPELADRLGEIRT
jgi:hypothetical protein